MEVASSDQLKAGGCRVEAVVRAGADFVSLA